MIFLTDVCALFASTPDTHRHLLTEDSESRPEEDLMDTALPQIEESEVCRTISSSVGCNAKSAPACPHRHLGSIPLSAAWPEPGGLG